VRFVHWSIAAAAIVCAGFFPIEGRARDRAEASRPGRDSFSAARAELPAAEATAGHAWLEIDLDAFEGNLRTLQAVLGPKTKICAVLKADAYGHGIALLMPSIIAAKVPCIGIASNEEARLVRAGGFTQQLMRIRTATAEEISAGTAYDIEESLGNFALAKAAAAIARQRGRIIRVHLALNSGGMSRHGIEMKTTQGQNDALQIAKLPGLEIVGIMSHFPVEDKTDVTRGLKTFEAEAGWVIAQAGLDRRKIVLHCANSFATLEVPESRLDLVRPGGLLYGDTVPSYTEYRRVMQFKSRVAAVNVYSAGNTVSYDRTFQLQRESRLANVPVGYSDGYRRAFSNRAFVVIRGQRRPVVGRVTMNSILVDVTDDPAVIAGDEVVLFGKQGASEVTQAELEESAGTILVEMYTIWGASNPRVVRRQ
jgi:alanine racemase